jgi:hypothetical protein
MRHLRFYKETHRWYVDLPEWTGSKSDLEMVSGADSMLDMMAEGKAEVHLTASEFHFIGSDKLIFKKKADDIGNGAYYFMEKYRGIKLDLNIWLCDVTVTALGGFPEKIYILKPM